MKRHIVTIEKPDETGELITQQFSYQHKETALALIQMTILLQNPARVYYKHIPAT